MAGEQMKFEEMKAAAERKDGSFSEALVGNPAEMTDEEVNLVIQVYQQALNNSPCPCGKPDQTFEQCCKSLWNIWQRQLKSLAQDPPERKSVLNPGKPEAPDGPPSDEEMVWVAQIGYSKKNPNAFRIDLPEGGQSISLEHLHEILMKLEKQIFGQIIVHQFRMSLMPKDPVVGMPGMMPRRHPPFGAGIPPR